MNTRSPILVAGLAALSLAAIHPAVAAGPTIYNFEIKGSDASSGGGSTALYNGPGALAGSGTTWNVINSGLATKDSNGNASTVSFAANVPGTFTSPNGGTTTDPDQLLSNFAYSSGAVQSMTFSGLPSASAFTLYLYGINGNYASQQTTFTLTQADHTTSIDSKTTTGKQDFAFEEGVNFVSFTGTTDATGHVYATYQGVPATVEGDFNGAQISVPAAAVPEASSTISLGVLLVLGGLAVAARRKSVRS